ncbi:MAG: hypothetical protein DRR08_33580 [Candidatus Parabeggiatoa sp. nov. 2]|nr:MAG: hypothetical protein B6247_30285 [Beggiatoa sp. 4572_84]RKZ46110.1 MAG: hypothetical protein DRR08_33580 [Gammaproteobacteria bacterium]
MPQSGNFRTKIPQGPFIKGGTPFFEKLILTQNSVLTGPNGFRSSTIEFDLNNDIRKSVQTAGAPLIGPFSGYAPRKATTCL